jgi:hypothetical protein
MPNCGVCQRAIPADEMKKDQLGNIRGQIWGGTPFGESLKFMPNVMENLALKCNRCGAWICSGCAEKTALAAGAGMIRHENCGGMFETMK